MEGRCACNQIKFNLVREPVEICKCYCSICKKLSHKEFISFAKYGYNEINFPTHKNMDLLQILSTKSYLFKQIESSHRARRFECSNCENLIFMYYIGSSNIWIAADCISNNLDHINHYDSYKS